MLNFLSQTLLVFVVLANSNSVVVEHTTADIALVVVLQELYKLVANTNLVLLLPLDSKELYKLQPSP